MSANKGEKGPRPRISGDGGAFRKWEPGKAKITSKGQLLVESVTRGLHSLYATCNPSFSYTSTLNPRRLLTDPHDPAGNNGHDNKNADLIMAVNDVIMGPNGQRFVIMDSLGSGTFGQVVKCTTVSSDGIGKAVAVKVVKNKPAYFNQGMIETQILEKLNQELDPDDECHIARLHSHFVHKRHLCLVFELLSINLYELIKQNRFCGLSINLIRIFLVQLLEAMTVLEKGNIIHCDLKPENILLVDLTSPKIKLIDFGSACYRGQTVYTYIQSRFYRSPEVIIGIPYDNLIDIWSLGCIAAELFLGLPLFPGNSEYDQIRRIINLLGNPPDSMVALGRNGSKYFQRNSSKTEKSRYVLKSEAQFCKEQRTRLAPAKKYFKYDVLEDIILRYPVKKSLSSAQKAETREARKCFLHFLQGVLILDPKERWTASQALQHPFITGETFSGKWEAPVIRREREKSTIEKLGTSLPTSIMTASSSEKAPYSSSASISSPKSSSAVKVQAAASGPELDDTSSRTSSSFSTTGANPAFYMLNASGKGKKTCDRNTATSISTSTRATSSSSTRSREIPQTSPHRNAKADSFPTSASSVPAPHSRSQPTSIPPSAPSASSSSSSKQATPSLGGRTVGSFGLGAALKASAAAQTSSAASAAQTASNRMPGAFPSAAEQSIPSSSSTTAWRRQNTGVPIPGSSHSAASSSGSFGHAALGATPSSYGSMGMDSVGEDSSLGQAEGFLGATPSANRSMAEMMAEAGIPKGDPHASSAQKGDSYGYSGRGMPVMGGASSYSSTTASSSSLTPGSSSFLLGSTPSASSFSSSAMTTLGSTPSSRYSVADMAGSPYTPPSMGRGWDGSGTVLMSPPDSFNTLSLSAQARREAERRRKNSRAEDDLSPRVASAAVNVASPRGGGGGASSAGDWNPHFTEADLLGTEESPRRDSFASSFIPTSSQQAPRRYRRGSGASPEENPEKSATSRSRSFLALGISPEDEDEADGARQHKESSGTGGESFVPYVPFSTPKTRRR